MLIFELAHVGTAETSLHSKYVGDVQLLVHCNSSRAILQSVHREATLLEAEKVAYFGQNIREHSCGVRLFFNIITIHEDVLSSRVSMEITVKHELPILGEPPDQSFHGEVYRMKYPRGSFPSPVEILTR